MKDEGIGGGGEEEDEEEAQAEERRRSLSYCAEKKEKNRLK